VTTGAGQGISAIHHREPVTLAQQDYAKWLGEDGKGAALLMTPAPQDHLAFFRVAPTVNSNRATGPELIEPLDDARTG